MVGLDVLLDVRDELVVGLAFDVLATRAVNYGHDGLPRVADTPEGTPVSASTPNQDSYWVEPGRLLAGSYPREPEPFREAGVTVFST
jgi:hypothetical protein